MTIKKFLISFLISCATMAAELPLPPEENAMKGTIERNETTELSPIPPLPKDALIHIFQFDRRNSPSFFFVCKQWQGAVVESQKREREAIEAWSTTIFPFSGTEMKKGFYRFMFYCPSLVKDNILFSSALRETFMDILNDKMKQITQWKNKLKEIGLTVQGAPFVYQNKPTFRSLAHIFNACDNLENFLFLSNQQAVGNLVLEVASLAKGPIKMNQNNQALSTQIMSLFKTVPKSEECSLLTLAGSIYRGWRSLQSNCQSLCEDDLKTGFGRSLVSKEMALFYSRTKYQTEGQTYLTSQLEQLTQGLLDYITRAEAAHNDLLISLIE